MSRKPIDQLSKSHKPHGQDGVWVEIRKQKKFSTPSIHRVTEIPKKTITDYAKRLIAGGYVKDLGYEGETRFYELVRDAGVHAPRVKRDGTPVTQGAATQNMWRSMRILKTFTPQEIVVHSNTELVSVSIETAKSYCSMLLKAKYLKVMQKAGPGRQATYKFVWDTGPKPPKIQRVKQVFDPNINKVTYAPGGGL